MFATAPAIHMRHQWLRFVTVAVACLMLLGFVGISLVYFRPHSLPCRDARVLVIQRYGAVFGIMNSLVGPVSIQCIGNTGSEDDVVTVTWYGLTAEHRATYMVDGATGVAHAADQNAAELDRVAQQLASQGGPLNAETLSSPAFH